MVAARIDFKKANEKKDLSYLAGWYCPLEMNRQWGRQALPGRDYKEKASSQFSFSLTLTRPPLGIKQKQIMPVFK